MKEVNRPSLELDHEQAGTAAALYEPDVFSVRNESFYAGYLAGLQAGRAQEREALLALAEKHRDYGREFYNADPLKDFIEAIRERR